MVITNSFAFWVCWILAIPQVTSYSETKEIRWVPSLRMQKWGKQLIPPGASYGDKLEKKAFDYVSFSKFYSFSRASTSEKKMYVGFTPLEKKSGRQKNGAMLDEHSLLRPDLNLFGLWEGFSGYTPGDHQAIFSTIYSVGIRFAWRLDEPHPAHLSHHRDEKKRSVLRAIHGPAAARARALDTFERR